MRKKILLVILLLLSTFTVLFGFAACFEDKHEHLYEQSIINPTCTEQGYTLHLCSCGESFKDNFVDALNHDEVFHNGQAATCDESGWSDYVTCTRCDYTTYSEIKMLGHSYENYLSNNDATCTKDATETAKCIRCDSLDTRIISNTALGHNFGQWTETKPATCTEKGEEQRVCMHDKTHIEVREIEKLNHVAGGWITDVEATCETSGLRHINCSVCNTELQKEIIEPLGHDYGEWEIVKVATCTEKGKEQRVCMHDKTHIEVREIEKLNHVAGGWITDVEATCETSGLRHVNCSECNTELQKEIIEPLGHNYGEWKVVKVATCTEKGKEQRVCMHDKTHIEVREIEKLNHVAGGWITDVETTCETSGLRHINCSVCNTELQKEIIEPLDHNYGEWEVVKVATCTEKGEEQRICKNDINHKETRGINEIPHISGDWITDKEATCEDLGIRHKECTVCKTHTVTEQIEAIGHNWDYTFNTIAHSAVCVNCGKQIINELHKWNDNDCPICGYDGGGSKGLNWDLSEDKSYYILAGIGYCRDIDIIIEETYNGKPVYEIGKRAFYLDRSINTIALPNNLKLIGDNAFDRCTNLTGVKFGTKLKTIEQFAFAGCASLNKIYIKDLAAWCGVEFQDTPLLYQAELYLNDEIVTELVIPGTVTKISSGAFRGCSSFESVVIADNVTDIGGVAFAYCKNLKYVKLGKGLKNIGKMSFSYCDTLTEIEYCADACDTSDSVFTSSGTATDGVHVSIGNGVQKLPDGLFYNKDILLTSKTIKLTDIEFEPNSICESIGEYAFYGCSSLRSITLPDSVTCIGREAFGDCSQLESIVISRGLKTVKDLAFDSCIGLNRIDFPSGVTEVGHNVLQGCNNLESVSVPFITNNGSNDGGFGRYFGAILDSEIKDKVPAKLETVIILGGYIRDKAFYNCNGIKSVIIGENVTQFSLNAFYGCSNLQSLTIGKNVAQIENGYSPRRGLNELSEVIVVQENLKYHSENNCIIETESKIMVFGCKSSVIPNDGSVTVLGQGCFGGYNNITSITIPEGVTEIQRYAIGGCLSLEEIRFPKSILTMSDWAISDLNETTLYVPAEIGVCFKGSVLYNSNVNLVITDGDKLEANAFKGWSGESIFIPDSVVDIGSGAFSGCRVKVAVVPLVACVYVCNGNDSLKSLEITNGSKLDRYMFSDRPLEALTLPSSITEIQMYTFSGCTSLSTINYKDTIEKWNLINKNDGWDNNSGDFTIYCTDGTIAKDGTVTYY